MPISEWGKPFPHYGRFEWTNQIIIHSYLKLEAGRLSCHVHRCLFTDFKG